jgi:MFS family permease
MMSRVLKPASQAVVQRWLAFRARLSRLRLPADDLLRDAAYRRLFTSILISSLGGQVSMLALPLTAAVLLKATPTQMGLLTAFELLPFVLLSLPTGVWLDRVRKLPVYIAGEVLLAVALATVPLAWWMGWLTMTWMYAVGFLLGCVHVVAGTAAQIVLTQVVQRQRLVEAHAKNALASSGSEVVGPGLAGALIKAVGAPVALLIDALALACSVLVLRGLRLAEKVGRRDKPAFMPELKAGLRFVRDTPLLVALAITMGLWQMCHYAAVVVQILFATRTLGMSEADVGASFVGLGVGTVMASVWGKRISSALGVGPSLTLGLAVSGLGWALCSVAPVGAWGKAMFALMLLCFGFGAVLTFINFLALRQAVTPVPLLARMTSTMRWLMLLPAGPGALIGGWLGDHVGLRASLAFAGLGALAVATAAWRHPVIRAVHHLPAPEEQDTQPPADGATRPQPLEAAT